MSFLCPHVCRNDENIMKLAAVEWSSGIPCTFFTSAFGRRWRIQCLPCSHWDIRRWQRNRLKLIAQAQRIAQAIANYNVGPYERRCWSNWADFKGKPAVKISHNPIKYRMEPEGLCQSESRSLMRLRGTIWAILRSPRMTAGNLP